MTSPDHNPHLDEADMPHGEALGIASIQACSGCKTDGLVRIWIGTPRSDGSNIPREGICYDLPASKATDLANEILAVAKLVASGNAS